MKEINPQETTRAYAFEMWMKAPMPMVTLFKTLDVSRLVRMSRRKGMKFNMLMCYCIGKAASGIKEFYLLPVGHKLMQYDELAVNAIIGSMYKHGYIDEIKNSVLVSVQGNDETVRDEIKERVVNDIKETLSAYSVESSVISQSFEFLSIKWIYYQDLG